MDKIFFDKIHKETLTLLNELKIYIYFKKAQDVQDMDDARKFETNCQIIKITTRLTYISTWMHFASDGSFVFPDDGCADNDYPSYMPSDLIELLDSSYALYKRTLNINKQLKIGNVS